MTNPFTYQTDRLLLKVLDESSASAVLDYYIRNRQFHKPWFAARDDSLYTLEHQRRVLADESLDFMAGRSIPFYLFSKVDKERIIGRISFSNIVHGCFHSCFLGYHLDEQAQGHGYAFEGLEAALKIVFKDFRLHRVEANIMPFNARSISLVQRLGFELEGLSRRYLEINGQWEDHLHYVLLNDGPLHQTDDYPVLTSDRLIIRLLEEKDIPSVIRYFDRNRQHLGKYNPVSVDQQASPAYWQTQIAVAKHHFQHGLQFDIGLFLRDKPSHLVGMINFSKVEPLPFSSCEIGYSVDHLMAGRGIMFEGLMIVLQYGFEGFGINRIYARLHVDNEQSVRLLQFLGFKEEGRIRQGVYLDGEYHDLLQMSLLRSDFQRG